MRYISYTTVPILGIQNLNMFNYVDISHITSIVCVGLCKPWTWCSVYSMIANLREERNRLKHVTLVLTNKQGNVHLCQTLLDSRTNTFP